MTNQPKNVIVVAVPEEADVKQQHFFLRDLASRMSEYRPYVVLDCSRLSTIDGPRIYFLLCCLEEALKRNGDVRLAGMTAQAKMMLAAAGADRIFQIFASNGDAIRSFLQRGARVERREEPQCEEDCVSQNAA
jgi:anti-sigma B factor antagonist